MNAATKPICVGMLLLGSFVAASGLDAQETKDQTPRIQVAILLDTSGSMQGLINQARDQLWKVVNEFATAKRGGKTPELQVALYQYGSGSIPSSKGFLRMVLPLTTDLDKVSEELFALKVGGSREYCGRVIKAATVALSWSGSNDDLKTIFIAGNEPFTQGDVDYRAACKAAIAKGITVNTIHCGPRQVGVDTKWEHGATLADGKYMHIDQNRKVVHISAPQDKELAQLGAELNKTYLPYGPRGKSSAANQTAQDANASRVSPGNSAQRAVAKASAHYRNSSWDLVDGVREGKIKLEDVKTEDLPEEMQRQSLAERKTYVAANQKKRAGLQKKIKELNEQRKKHVEAEMKKRSESGGKTLDAVIVSTVREQAAEKGIEFK